MSRITSVLVRITRGDAWSMIRSYNSQEGRLAHGQWSSYEKGA